MKKPMLKILNVAWVGHGDFGDEVMAFVLRRFFKEKTSGVTTYYSSGKEPMYRGPEESAHSILHRWSPGGRLSQLTDPWLLKKFNALLIGGGSIFHSMNSIGWKLKLAKIIKHKNPQAFVGCVGVTIGPLANQNEINLCRELLVASDQVMVRDLFSYNLACGLLNPEKISRSFDLAMLLPRYLSMDLATGHKQDPERIGISFVTTPFTENGIAEKRFECFLKLLDSLLKSGKKITLFTLYTGSIYGDMELNRRLKSKCSRPDRVDVHEFNGNIELTISEFQTCSSIITMRLHGAIMAYLLNIPFLSIAHNLKNEFFCETVNYPKKFSTRYGPTLETEEILATMNKLSAQGQMVFINTVKTQDAAQSVHDNLSIFANGMQSLRE